ncbi:trans-aconitate 2-methyltransferase [Azoarcus sp. DD4]|uniref:class I SAM-dependent methyltransferase n=1 Tax=Azoarcus sp. DD4 TaxID=2027405 RepID=UPI00143CD29C|nr:class I SAM-dependent methyltransferase [Azoarcus sp. DD4]
MTDHTAPPTLRDHLLSFGIRPAASGGAPQAGLTPKDAKRLAQLGKALARARPRQADVVAFYEFVSRPDIAALIHSGKADAIRATGEFVAARLAGTRILDVGCNIGYLTSWYARCRPAAEVWGIDASPSSIDVARRFATRLGLANLRYASSDGQRYQPTAAFDTLVDTQGMIDADIDPALLRRMFGWLQPEGRLLCVPALGTLARFESFLDRLDFDAVAVLSLDWLPFVAQGERGVYPALVMAHAAGASGLPRAALVDAYQRGVLDFRRGRSLA